jgi:hypothetical protein
MDYEELNYQSVSRSEELERSAAFPVLMRKVYTWMTLALAITGFTAYAVATSPSILNLIYGNSYMIWVLFGAELLLVIGISGAIDRLSLPVATLLFVLYSVINGAVFSSIFFAYTMSSIANVFFITAGTFAGMSLFGYFTKSDLSSWGRVLFMALIGLIIATVVNLFLHSTGLNMILSYAGVLIFVGLTAYDTQKIKQMFLEAPDSGETMQKYALLGALTLYLDFINLFIYLLRLFGRRD